MRKLAACAFAALLLAASACGDDDDAGTGDRAGLEAALAAMVLQRSDIPEELQPVSAAFAENADVTGAGVSKEQLDAWGRILGYQVDYQRTEPAAGSVVTAVSSSVSLYRDEEGAGFSFADRKQRALTADWTTTYSDFSELEQADLSPIPIVDDSLWLHFTGFKEIGPGDRRVISSDLVLFRIGRAWGTVQATSNAGAGVVDREFILTEVQDLVETQITRVRSGLGSEGLD